MHLSQVDRPWVLLTGATGLLGRYLLRDLLRQGYAVAVIVRAERTRSALARVQALLEIPALAVERDLPALRHQGQLYVLEGDLAQPGLGLSGQDREWVASHCRWVLHSAASLSFYLGRDGEPYRSNVEGVRQLLAFCRETQPKQLALVSTAYVCGQRQDRVRETETDVGQLCGNDYEWSKLIAERYARQEDALERLLVFRPSIIVGDSRTGYTSSFHGFYTPLRLGLAVSQTQSAVHPDEPSFLTRLGLAGHEQKNLVPVDWVSAAIVELLDRPAPRGFTYHLTHPEPVTVALLDEVFATAISEHQKDDAPARGPSADGGRSFRNRADSCEVSSQPAKSPEINVDFEQQMQVYRAYLRHDPIFDREHLVTALPELVCPPLDRACLLRLAGYALRAKFGYAAPPTADRPAAAGDWLRRPECAADLPAPGLQLELVGTGEVWHCAGPGAPWITGAATTALPRICIAAKTLPQLARGELTLSEALHRGSLVLLGPSDALAACERYLERCVATARLQPMTGAAQPRVSHAELAGARR